ncbi:hypothetical protein RHGRI_027144 [Rhododendron griersonianum]|uniref:Uncharacterized protein n=1 Tax=Rhododendron griersonianum TaxID=479676 RepID=A0AAV6IV31_9ERIC|nr:hypothetical protein RHGRI_027144 [Rhododendron griersonianum]
MYCNIEVGWWWTWFWLWLWLRILNSRTCVVKLTVSIVSITWGLLTIKYHLAILCSLYFLYHGSYTLVTNISALATSESDHMTKEVFPALGKPHQPRHCPPSSTSRTAAAITFYLSPNSPPSNTFPLSQLLQAGPSPTFP